MLVVCCLFEDRISLRDGRYSVKKEVVEGMGFWVGPD